MAAKKVSARNEDEVWNNLYAKRLKSKQIKLKLKVDDRVRHNQKHRRLAVLPTYKINELDGTLKGTLYADDLQKVTVMDDEWDGEVVKRKGDKFLVRRKGWPDKFHSDWETSFDEIRVKELYVWSAMPAPSSFRVQFHQQFQESFTLPVTLPRSGMENGSE